MQRGAVARLGHMQIHFHTDGRLLAERRLKRVQKRVYGQMS